MALQDPMQQETLPAAHPEDMAAMRGLQSARRQKSIGGKRSDLYAALGFLAPNFLGFMLFVTFPILFSLFLVFTNWSLIPAIEKQWIGYENVRELLGFRPVSGAAVSGGTGILLSYLGSYVILVIGILASLVAFARKMPGVRLAGWMGIATGAALLIESAVAGSNIGWALGGITLAFASLFFVLDADSSFSGRAALGPGMIIGGVLGVRLLEKSFLSQWEPIDPLFYKYFYNTLYLMFLIPIQIVGSLALALALSKPLVSTSPARRFVLTAGFASIAFLGGIVLWMTLSADIGLLWMVFWGIATLGMMFGVTAFRTIFFLPSFTAGVAIMLLWKQVYNPDFGLLNDMLRRLMALFSINAPLPRWILDPHWAKPALIIMGFWATVGGTNMLIYLAGLANVPEEMYEAARIDGANKWQEFINVTWPQLAPTTFFIVIMSTIAGLQGGFEQARVMTEGGPAGSTKTLSYYIYEKAFQELSLGYASAIAWIMFIMIFVLTALNWKFGNQYVNE